MRKKLAHKTELSRRDVVRLGLYTSALALGPNLIGCKGKRRLKVANWSDLISADAIPEFQAQTGCRVIYENYSSNEDLLAKIKINPATYDVIFPSDYMVERMAREGLIRELDDKLLKNISNLNDRILDQDFDPGNRYSLPYVYWGTGLAVNEARYSDPGTVGSTWTDLFLPESGSRVTVLDEMRYTLGMALIAGGFSVNTKEPNEIEKAADFLIDLKPRIMAFATDVIDLLAAGEPTVSYAYSGDVYQASQANPKVRFSVPDGGGIVGIDNMCITAQSTEPALAHQFIDFLMQPEVASSITKETYYATANAEATKQDLIPPEIALEEAIYLPVEKYKNLHVLRDLGAANARYLEAWQRVKRS